MTKRSTDIALTSYLDPTKHVYSETDLKQLYEIFREKRLIRNSMSISSFTKWATEKNLLKEISLHYSHGKAPARYSTQEFSPYELALSLRKNAYLSHGTAAFLLGLTNEEPQTVYLNVEQSSKEARGTSDTLAQGAIDLAFSRSQRQSKHRVTTRDISITLLHGKQSGNLGVQKFKGKTGESLTLTDIERTLIDITVRPTYGGGIRTVFRCYLSSKGRVSTPKLIRTLKQLNYTYPYHQAIGFYLAHAGYSKESWEELRENLQHDFYLAHDMNKTIYNQDWRIHIPKGFADFAAQCRSTQSL